MPVHPPIHPSPRVVTGLLAPVAVVIQLGPLITVSDRPAKLLLVALQQLQPPGLQAHLPGLPQHKIADVPQPRLPRAVDRHPQPRQLQELFGVRSGPAQDHLSGVAGHTAGEY